MRLLTTLAMLVCLSASLFGQEALVITSKGYFPVHDGIPSSTPIPMIFRTGATDPATPTVPSDPPVSPTPDPTIPPFVPIEVPNLTPDENKDINELLESALKINDPTSAQGLSLVYAYALGLLKKDKLNNDQAWAFIPQASLESLKITGGKDWQPFRDIITKQANKRSGATALDKAGSLRYFAIVERALEVSYKDTPPVDLDKATLVNISNAEVFTKIITPPKPTVGAK